MGSWEDGWGGQSGAEMAAGVAGEVRARKARRPVESYRVAERKELVGMDNSW